MQAGVIPSVRVTYVSVLLHENVPIIFEAVNDARELLMCVVISVAPISA